MLLNSVCPVLLVCIFLKDLNGLKVSADSIVSLTIKSPIVPPCKSITSLLIFFLVIILLTASTSCIILSNSFCVIITSSLAFKASANIACISCFTFSGVIFLALAFNVSTINKPLATSPGTSTLFNFLSIVLEK